MDEVQTLKDCATGKMLRLQAAENRLTLAANAVGLVRLILPQDAEALKRAQIELRAARLAVINAAEEYAYAARAAFAGMYEPQP